MRSFLRLIIVLAVPIVLTMMMVRLLTLPWYPAWQYGRPGFPADPLGMPRDERLRLAQASIRFLNIPWQTAMLQDLRFDDGTPAYEEQELEHMDDVKDVYNALTFLAVVMGVAAMVAVVFLRRGRGEKGTGCGALWTSLGQGATMTLGLLLALGVWMLMDFDGFFTFFHSLFFEPGTWLFSYSDTLIRLFPLPFWQDAGFIVAGGVSVLSLFLVAVSVWQGQRCEARY
jgi:integral membrane protein (TIGR01906 family)